MKNFQILMFAVILSLNIACQAQNKNKLSKPSSGAARLENQFSDGVIGTHNPDLLKDLLSDDFISHHFPAPGNNGKEVFIGGMKGLLAGFPDIKVTRVQQYEEGDKVFTYAYWEANHTGEFMGIPATGKHVHVEYMDIWRVKDGRIVENWVVMDILGLLKQLGVVK